MIKRHWPSRNGEHFVLQVNSTALMHASFVTQIPKLVEVFKLTKKDRLRAYRFMTYAETFPTLTGDQLGVLADEDGTWEIKHDQAFWTSNRPDVPSCITKRVNCHGVWLDVIPLVDRPMEEWFGQGVLLVDETGSTTPGLVVSAPGDEVEISMEFGVMKVRADRLYVVNCREVK